MESDKSMMERLQAPGDNPILDILDSTRQDYPCPSREYPKEHGDMKLVRIKLVVERPELTVEERGCIHAILFMAENEIKTFKKEMLCSRSPDHIRESRNLSPNTVQDSVQPRAGFEQNLM